MSEQTTYPKWFIQFAQDVLDMRDAQADYFKQPDAYRLRISKVKERTADAWLERMTKAGVIKHKAKPVDNQPSLFKK